MSDGNMTRDEAEMIVLDALAETEEGRDAIIKAVRRMEEALQDAQAQERGWAAIEQRRPLVGGPTQTTVRPTVEATRASVDTVSPVEATTEDELVAVDEPVASDISPMRELGTREILGGLGEAVLIGRARTDDADFE